MRRANNIERDGKILRQEINGIGVVESNPADFGRRHDYGIGFCGADPSLSLLLPSEIDLHAIGCKNIAFFRFEPAHDCTADHTAVASDIDTLGREVEQRCITRSLSHDGSYALARSAPLPGRIRPSLLPIDRRLFCVASQV